MTYINNLETERLILRPTEDRDVGDIYEYMSDPEVMRYRVCGVQSREAVEQWVRNIVTCGRDYARFVGKVHQIVLKSEGKVIGYCYLDNPWPEGYREVMTNGKADFADLSYGLTRKYWGNGYATEAALAVLAYGFHQAGVEKVGAAVNPDNKLSIRVLQRCAFVYSRKIHWPNQELVDFYLLTISKRMA
jgi:[ribosomal protein S5]-alanine N-acetyltransferase